MSDYGWHRLMWTVIILPFSENTAADFTINTITAATSAHQFTTPLYYYTPLLRRCNKNVLFIMIIISMHASYQLPLTATTDIRGTSSPQVTWCKRRRTWKSSRVANRSVKGTQFRIQISWLWRFAIVTRASGPRWFWGQAQWPQPHRAPPTLVDATSRLI